MDVSIGYGASVSTYTYDGETPEPSIWLRGSTGMKWDDPGMRVVWMRGSQGRVCPCEEYAGSFGMPPSHKIEGTGSAQMGRAGWWRGRRREGALAHGRRAGEDGRKKNDARRSLKTEEPDWGERRRLAGRCADEHAASQAAARRRGEGRGERMAGAGSATSPARAMPGLVAHRGNSGGRLVATGLADRGEQGRAGRLR